MVYNNTINYITENCISEVPGNGDFLPYLFTCHTSGILESEKGRTKQVGRNNYFIIVQKRKMMLIKKV